MFHWSYTEKVQTQATAEQVWAQWVDVKNWSSWDHEIDSSELLGPFTEGTSGRIQLTNGQKVAFKLMTVQPNHKFINVAELPYTKLYYSHTYITTKNACYISHKFSMKGLLAPLFGRLIGKNIQRNLKSVLLKLSERAQSSKRVALKAERQETIV